MSPFSPIDRPLRALVFFAALTAADRGMAQHDCLSTKRSQGQHPISPKSSVLASMDILHQRIALDLTLGNIIRGNCAIRAVPREEEVANIVLDLEGLTVDSVVSDNGPLAFTHTENILDITFNAPLGPADTVDLTVYYGGDPIVDASGFGGFYTTSALLYNLGVAFESMPHSYGRVWFPCMDNFTERNTYEFLIKTAGNKRAWCNGELLERIQLGSDTVVNHWRIDRTIPAYLASVAASNFVVARDTFPNISGTTTPVELIAAPGDTTGMKSSFINLEQAFYHFEDLFGPYLWNKVGYVLTPVGAMEHATSVHYPRSIATGSLQDEDVMAHELAHHWFGNLVTCDRAEEMYINEGFAEYLSYLFLEKVYGRTRYMNTVRANHRTMVHRAHLMDDGWWTLSEVPQEWTYGEHSYNKGADVLHTLRSYLGDEAFSAGLTSFLTTYAFQPVNSTLLRDHLTATTGVDLTDFFNDWIHQPGWAAFEIDAQRFTQNEDGWLVELSIGQKQRGPADPYNNVPTSITVVGTDVNDVFHEISPLAGPSTEVVFTVPFEPAWVWLNADDRISLAMTGVTDTITNTVNMTYDLANFQLMPEPGDTTVVRMEQYWVPPDEGTFEEPFAYTLSPDRYWRITGNWNDARRFTARVTFDGRNTVSSSYDLGLMQGIAGLAFHEDSVVLLHRPGPAASWKLWADEVNTLGSATDGNCRITLDSLSTGEYVFARRTSAVGIERIGPTPMHWTILPNPTKGTLSFHTDQPNPRGTIRLYDARGREVSAFPVMDGTTRADVTELAVGNYTARFYPIDGGSSPVGTVVKQ